MRRLVLITMVVLLSTPIALSQDFYDEDYDYDGDCAADYVTSFLKDLGRGQYFNPCPPDGPEQVSQTGQTTQYSVGDDGNDQAGVEAPEPRFTDNEDGTVTDKLTGLMWLKDANCMETSYPDFDKDGTVFDGKVTWQHALDFVAGINDGTYGVCGAGYTAWKIPNVNEFRSLALRDYSNPALPNTAGTGQWSEGDPFNNVQSHFYWSSASNALSTYLAWFVDMSSGFVFFVYKNSTGTFYVWPVRDGHKR